MNNSWLGAIIPYPSPLDFLCRSQDGTSTTNYVYKSSSPSNGALSGGAPVASGSWHHRLQQPTSLTPKSADNTDASAFVLATVIVPVTWLWVRSIFFGTSYTNQTSYLCKDDCRPLLRTWGRFLGARCRALWCLIDLLESIFFAIGSFGSIFLGEHSRHLTFAGSILLTSIIRHWVSCVGTVSRRNQKRRVILEEEECVNDYFSIISQSLTVPCCISLTLLMFYVSFFCFFLTCHSMHYV